MNLIINNSSMIPGFAYCLIGLFIDALIVWASILLSIWTVKRKEC